MSGAHVDPEPADDPARARLSVLLATGRVSAEATLERLLAIGIEARILDQPNVFVRLASGGNYRVRVVVPEADLALARAELARWEVEAGPRVQALAGEVRRVLVLAALPALGLAAWLLTRDPVPKWSLPAIFGFWLGGLGAWVLWSRMRSRESQSSKEPGGAER